MVKCSNCGHHVSIDEYDFDEDRCLFCEFPETSPTMPTEFSYERGFAENKTADALFLENIDSIPRKRSAKENEQIMRKFYKNYHKKRKLYK